MKNIDPDNPPEEVKKWIRQLKRVLKNHPEGIWLFAGSGSLYVMANKDGERVLIYKGNMSDKYIIDDVTPSGLDIDGGDW